MAYAKRPFSCPYPYAYPYPFLHSLSLSCIKSFSRNDRRGDFVFIRAIHEIRCHFDLDLDFNSDFDSRMTPLVPASARFRVFGVFRGLISGSRRKSLSQRPQSAQRCFFPRPRHPRHPLPLANLPLRTLRLGEKEEAADRSAALRESYGNDYPKRRLRSRAAAINVATMPAVPGSGMTVMVTNAEPPLWSIAKFGPPDAVSL